MAEPASPRMINAAGATPVEGMASTVSAGTNSNDEPAPLEPESSG